MQLTEIKKIEEILILDKPLLRHDVLSLAAPVENNGSFLAHVELRLKNEKNFEEKFDVVAKLIPPNVNYQTTESFKNEITFYSTIVPLLQDFLKLQDAEPVNFFPKYYGGRLTLNSKVKAADRDAVFFLENLKSSGNVNLNFNFLKSEGLDYLIKLCDLDPLILNAVKVLNFLYQVQKNWGIIYITAILK